MATVKQKSEQYNAYVQRRSKEVIALQTELEAIVEQGQAHFAQGFFDVVFREFGLAADVFKNIAEAAG